MFQQEAQSVSVPKIDARTHTHRVKVFSRIIFVAVVCQLTKLNFSIDKIKFQLHKSNTGKN
jgi:hypothetical protein